MSPFDLRLLLLVLRLPCMLCNGHSFDKMQDSAWLNEYGQFHQRERFAPNAQYLIYTCRASIPGGPRHCLGVGDRFRLIGFMLRVAAAFQRVLLIDWQSPMPIESFLMPTQIDWRLNATEQSRVGHLHVDEWLTHLQSPPRSVRYLRVSGNAPYESFFPGSLNFTASYSTAWKYLFQPSASLLRAVHKQRTGIFKQKPYIGIHIRMGDRAPGSAFNPSSVPRRDTRLSHRDAVNIIRCVKVDHAHKSIFMATDNAALKAAVKYRMSSGMTGVLENLAFRPASVFSDVFVQGCTDCMVNPVFQHDFSNQSVADIFVELLLLAKSNCFYYLPSNFATLVQAIRGDGACSHMSKKSCPG